MRIALFGATGPTGKYLITEALKKGYQLSVYARDANKLNEFRSQVDITTGDLTNAEAIGKCIQGSDAVVSALGPNSIKMKEKRPVMMGLENIVSAMRKENVKRLIQVSTAASQDRNDSFEIKTALNLLLVKLIAPAGYDDVKATGDLIRSSDLDWTLVRIPNLKDGPATGTIHVGYYGKSKLRMTLTRGNLAEFVMKEVQAKDFLRAAPAISN